MVKAPADRMQVSRPPTLFREPDLRMQGGLALETRSTQPAGVWPGGAEGRERHAGAQRVAQNLIAQPCSGSATA